MKNMRKYTRFLGQDVKRALTAKGFVIGVVLLLAVFINAFHLYVGRGRTMSTYEIIVDAMALSGFGPFAAVFPSLGYSTQFVQEHNSGYLKMIISRMSWKYYGITRIISTGLSGGFVVGIPFFIVCVLAYTLGVPGVPENGFMEGTKMVYYLQQYGDWYVLCSKVLLGFLFGAMFALVSLAFAVWSLNRYVAMIAPFILYEAMWVMLYEVRFLNPIYLVRGDDLNSYPLSMLMELMYIVLAAVVVWFGLKKRVKYE
jgi:hypothetical protein